MTGFGFSGTKRVLREVSSASAAAEFLLFARAKRRNPEKARPTLAPAYGRCPALLAGLGPARTRPSMASNMRAFPPSPAPRLGAIDGTQGRRSEALALDPPSRRSRQQSGGSAAQRARAGSARVSRRYTDVPSRNPAGPARTLAQRGRDLRVAFLLPTSLWRRTAPQERRERRRRPRRGGGQDARSQEK